MQQRASGAASACDPAILDAAVRPDLFATQPTSVHAAAEHGLSGSGGSLPYLDQIQRAFGDHDVSHVRAHTGERAAAGARAMGAEAFASGDQVAFAGTPTLHTAAHEAAHVVQQRAGVRLDAGVGAAGDAYERHADAVADRVVSGQSAVDLLDQYAGGRGPTPGGSAVQRKLTIKGTVIWDAEAVWEQINGPELGGALEYDESKIEAAKAMLRGWVSSLGPKGVGSMRLTSGVDRDYPDVAQVREALIGEVRAQSNLQKETVLAQQLSANPQIIANLKTLMLKIHTHVEAQKEKVKLWQEMQGAYRGLWTFMGGPWRVTTWAVKDVMAQPYDNIKANFNCIKMAANTLKFDGGRAEMFVPKQRDGAYHGGEEEKVPSDTKRHNTMSLDENWFWTREARTYDLPLTAGVSGSMNRMYFLAQQVGATDRELVALAWAGHVVFNQHYTQFGNDPHRLHEIMDPLTHYQAVDYNATKYAKLVEDTMEDGIQWPARH